MVSKRRKANKRRFISQNSNLRYRLITVVKSSNQVKIINNQSSLTSIRIPPFVVLEGSPIRAGLELLIKLLIKWKACNEEREMPWIS